MPSTVEVLRHARETLSDPKRWTQGVSAEDAYGCPVSPADPAAARWCLLGAIWRHTQMSFEPEVCVEADPEVCVEADPEVCVEAAIRDRFHPYNSILDFNDSWLRTHQDVLDVLDDAIKYAREAQV